MAKKSKTDNGDTDYINLVKSAKNVIFHGAPGTGKTYLAKQIAAKIVSDGRCDQYSDLAENESFKDQLGFIQFYPGYDYSNFVEGYKPKPEENELNLSVTPGILKRFIDKVRDKQKKEQEIYENLKNLREKDSTDSDRQELKKAVIKRLRCYIEEKRPFWTYRSPNSSGQYNEFTIAKLEKDKINVSSRFSTNVPSLDVDSLLKGPDFAPKKPFGINETNSNVQQTSYYRPIYDSLFTPPNSKFVFIIDEINRGDASSIFGEVFYAIDPGNRGCEGKVTLQYSREEFYIPKNVFFIGTMNDIDRSVEPFDFAFRRRWNFIEIEPKKTRDAILDSLTDDPVLKKERKNIEERMKSLNSKICAESSLGPDYQIGAAYFLKLKDLNNDFKKRWDYLWDYDLYPLLEEYVQGMDNEEKKKLLDKFQEAYYGKNRKED